MPGIPLNPTEPNLGPPPQHPDDALDLQLPKQHVYTDETDDDGERIRVATPEQEEAALGEEVTELTDEERMWFSTLLTVGRRTKVINVFDHSVTIQNINTDDDMNIGLFCRDYQGAPPADQRAFQLATCATGVISIDGAPLYTPLSEAIGADELFRHKVEKLRKFYPVVITQIYREILRLDAEFLELAQKLGKLEG